MTIIYSYLYTSFSFACVVVLILACVRTNCKRPENIINNFVRYEI
jgi:hypothetical protein